MGQRPLFPATRENSLLVASSSTVLPIAHLAGCGDIPFTNGRHLQKERDNISKRLVVAALEFVDELEGEGYLLVIG